MNDIKILCTPRLSKEQVAAIDEYACSNGLTREEALRHAVAFFCAHCVPTHSREEQPAKAASF